jgi:peroxiredoxin
MTEPTTQARPVVSSRWPLLLVGFVLVIAGVALVGSLFVDRTNAVVPPTPPDLAKEAQADLERRNYRPLSGELQALLTSPDYSPVPTQAHPLLGQAAPDFTLPDTEGKPWHLSEHLAQGPVVVVFYYGYHCNHCVSQLFALNKDLAKFHELGAEVVAISADPSERTRQRYARYGSFAFPVLSSADHAVAERYGTFSRPEKEGEEGELMHGTFVIDRQGRMVWANRGDGPFTENQTLLRVIHRAERKAPPGD